MTDENPNAEELLRDAADFRDRFLTPLLSDANANGENPAAMMYALLNSALEVALTHFPDHAESVYASATQMVFEARFGEPSSGTESRSAPPN
ncbi:MAG: hypothetical protein ACI8PT_004418 [Gammaproteobacteria bacterium]|jgi:hypothetical protein